MRAGRPGFERKIRGAALRRACYPPPVNDPVPQRVRSDRGRIVASMLALYFIWGSTFLAIRLALPGFPPLMMSGLRFVCAGGIFYFLLRLRGESRPSRVQ